MGTGRRFRKKHLRRPVKSGTDRRRRDKVQKKRLIALGVPADRVAKMNARQIKDLLKYPAKLKTK